MNDMSANSINVPVDVLCLSVSPPIIRKGRMTCRETGSCEVMLDEPETAFHAGMRVILDGGPDSTFRIMGMVVEMTGSLLAVDIERKVEPDKRAFPRVWGGVHVRYRVLSPAEHATIAPAWIDGDDTPSRNGQWREPDPFMNFSGSGIKFEDQLYCKVDDLLLMELHVAPSKQHWHLTGRVVRIEHLQPDELEAVDEERRKYESTHRIAVHYEHIPEEAREALAVFTLKIQDALLGI